MHNVIELHRKKHEEFSNALKEIDEVIKREPTEGFIGIVLKSDGSSYTRISGDFAFFRCLGALEATKFDLLKDEPDVW